jgi:hypothetical protein
MQRRKHTRKIHKVKPFANIARVLAFGMVWCEQRCPSEKNVRPHACNGWFTIAGVKSINDALVITTRVEKSVIQLVKYPGPGLLSEHIFFATLRGSSWYLQA